MRKGKLKKIIALVFLALSVLFMGITAYRAAFVALFPSKLPFFCNYTHALVLSGSMEPTLSMGDMVICKREEGYQINDVIIYYDEQCGEFVMHRIVGNALEGFITKGDFNPDNDPLPVRKENIQGKVVRTIPNMKTVRDIAVGALLVLLVEHGVKLIVDSCKTKSQEGDKEIDEEKV